MSIKETYLLLLVLFILGFGCLQPLEELSARLESDSLAVLLLWVGVLLPLQEGVLPEQRSENIQKSD